MDIFLSYAREDKAFLRELRRQLKPLEIANWARVWHDEEIQAGGLWDPEIRQHLQRSSIVVLLVSPAFFDSEFIKKEELPLALRLKDEQTARIVPVIVSRVRWQLHPALGAMQALPTDARPVDEWEKPGYAWESVVLAIEDLVRVMREAQGRTANRGMRFPALKLATGVSRLCDRVEHKTNFIAFSALPQGHARRRRPHVFVVAGGVSDSHRLLIERFHDNEIRQLAEADGCTLDPEIVQTDKYATKDWSRFLVSFGWDLFQKLHALELFDPTRPSAAEIAKARRGLRRFQVIQHDLDAGEFQNKLGDFLSWYIDDFWRDAQFDAARFFIFINVIYGPDAGPRSRVHKRIESELRAMLPETGRNIQESATGCPGCYLGELNEILLTDVQHWVQELRVYPTTEAAHEKGNVIFAQAPRDSHGKVRMDGIYGCLEQFRISLSEGKAYP